MTPKRAMSLHRKLGVALDKLSCRIDAQHERMRFGLSKKELGEFSQLLNDMVEALRQPGWPKDGAVSQFGVSASYKRLTIKIAAKDEQFMWVNVLLSGPHPVDELGRTHMGPQFSLRFSDQLIAIFGGLPGFSCTEPWGGGTYQSAILKAEVGNMPKSLVVAGNNYADSETPVEALNKFDEWFNKALRRVRKQRERK